MCISVYLHCILEPSSIFREPGFFEPGSKKMELSSVENPWWIFGEKCSLSGHLFWICLCQSFPVWQRVWSQIITKYPDAIKSKVEQKECLIIVRSVRMSDKVRTSAVADPWDVLNLQNNLIHTSGGSKGRCQGRAPPLCPISFILVQFLAKILPNNRSLSQTQGLAPPSGESWIHHWDVMNLQNNLFVPFVSFHFQLYYHSSFFKIKRFSSN